jgi:peptidoglycan/LPS O-acetylase OafA/YrhL
MLHHTNVELNAGIAITIIMAVLIASMILYLVIEKPIDEIRQRRATGVMTSPQRKVFHAINAPAQI